jgi:predicted RNA methylase
VSRGPAVDDGDPLTRAALLYLASGIGQQLLAAAAAPDDPWRLQEQLRQRHPAAWCRAAAALVDLRRRGRAKFAGAAAMFFDRAGLEMATGEVVAAHRAARFAAGARVLDLCCGIGGDLLALAPGRTVVGIDAEPRRVDMARLNAAALGGDAVRLAVADVQDLRLRGDAVFIDPARRAPAGRRQRHSEDYQPPLSWALQVARQIPATAVKVSPAIAEDELPAQGEVEWVSWRGQCREAGLYFGPLATARRRATVLPVGATLVDEPTAAPVPVAPPGPVLYDPDPAVVRAHLIEPLARQLGAWRLDPQLAYLCSDRAQATPLAAVYRVLTWMPFQLKRLRQRLVAEGWQPVEGRKRAVATEPDELRRRLGPVPAGRPVILVHTRVEQGPIVGICENWTG